MRIIISHLINMGLIERFSFIEKNIIGDKITITTAQLIHNCSLGFASFLILFADWMNIFIIAPIYFLWTSPLISSTDYLKNMCFYNFY